MWTWLILCVVGSATAEIPKAECRLHAADFDECMKDFVVGLIPVLASQGIPELHVLPLDPLQLPSLSVKLNSKLIRGDLKAQSSVIKGLSNTEIRKFRTNFDDPQHLILEIDTFHPKLIYEGVYKGDIKFESYEVDGDGDFRLTLRDVEVFGKSIAHVVTIEGTDFFQVDELLVELKIGNLKIQMTNLLPENPELGKLALTLANNMWETYFNEFLPFVKPRVEQIVKDLINKYTLGIPIKELININ